MEQKLPSRFTYYVVHYRGLKQNEAPSYVRGLLFHGHPKYPRKMPAAAMPMIASEASSSRALSARRFNHLVFPARHDAPWRHGYGFLDSQNPA